MTPRSYLFVPGTAEEKVSRAEQRGADAVILDLEDAVPAGAKDLARQQVSRALAAPPTAGERWVRVNRPPQLAADIAAVAGPGLTGVVVPKAAPDLLAEVGSLLTAAERRHHLTVGSLAVIALIETAHGLLSATAVAAAERVVRLGLGEADLVGELGLVPSAGRTELTALRLQIVLASAAAGLTRPVAPVETDLTDLQRLRSSTEALQALGFRARTAIHPRQLDTINQVFTPTADEVARARRTLAALAAAEATGSGVAVGEDNQFIDPAVARSAQDVLLRHNDTSR